MWQQPLVRRNTPQHVVVPEGDLADFSHQDQPQSLASSSSQLSLSYYDASQRSSLSRSHSVGSVQHQSGGVPPRRPSRSGMGNEAFMLRPYFSPHQQLNNAHGQGASSDLHAAVTNAPPTPLLLQRQPHPSKTQSTNPFMRRLSNVEMSFADSTDRSHMNNINNNININNINHNNNGMNIANSIFASKISISSSHSNQQATTRTTMTKPNYHGEYSQSSASCSSSSDVDDDSSFHRQQSGGSYHHQQLSNRSSHSTNMQQAVDIANHRLSRNRQQFNNKHGTSLEGGVPSLIRNSSASSSPTPDQVHNHAAPNSNSNINNNNNNNDNSDNINYNQSGPSELYRLIATPPHNEPLDWDIILHRAKTHPHEACFFDPNLGGHVYALHRLLRRAGDEAECRPPYSVVEAVMLACPRAVTRKQAVIDDDDFMEDSESSNASRAGIIHVEGGDGMHVDGGGMPSVVPMLLNGNNGAGGNDANLVVQLQNMMHGLQPPPPLPLQQQQQPALPQQQLPMDDDDSEASSQHPQMNHNADHDDVRFEYPLAIACECEQDGEVVRLLASSVWKTKPVYRSEVFRSLDYASLPNHLVRILLEEYAGCVLERGTDSEANEGDDDDCPLEKVLFWWDDPDMLGMEEDIANYPNCDMNEDLCDLWEKIRMMLYAAATGTMVGYDGCKESFKVLHHALRIVSNGGVGDVRFPTDYAHALLLLAKFIQREKVSMFRERDESGSLPIHIAVSGKVLLRSNQRVDEDNVEGENGQDAMDGVIEAAGQLEVGEQDANVQEAALPPEEQQDPVVQAPPGAGDQDDGGEEEEEDDDDEEEDDVTEGEEDVGSSSVSSGMEIIRLLLYQHPTSIKLRDSQTGSLPIHLALECNPQAIDAINYFLELYPRSVTMPNGSGRLPVHIALLQNSPTWEKILSMSPIALESRDPITGLLPFQLAAMSKSDAEESKDDELDSLSTSYRLLRMSPCLASGLAKVKSPPRSLIEQQIMARYKPRVTKLEEENEKLRQQVAELQNKLQSLQTMDSASSFEMRVKKRKSVNSLNFSSFPSFSALGGSFTCE